MISDDQIAMLKIEAQNYIRYRDYGGEPPMFYGMKLENYILALIDRLCAAEKVLLDQQRAD